MTAQANQHSQSSQFGFQQQQQVSQPQQQFDTATVQQQNQFQEQCFVLACDQTITGRNLQYSRQNYFSCDISSLNDLLIRWFHRYFETQVYEIECCYLHSQYIRINKQNKQIQFHEKFSYIRSF